MQTETYVGNARKAARTLLSIKIVTILSGFVFAFTSCSNAPFHLIVQDFCLRRLFSVLNIQTADKFIGCSAGAWWRLSYPSYDIYGGK